MVYSNLVAELIRSNISLNEAAERLHITLKTFKAKVNGKSDWSWKQVRVLRRMITTTSDIDFLFSEDVSQRSA